LEIIREKNKREIMIDWQSSISKYQKLKEYCWFIRYFVVFLVCWHFENIHFVFVKKKLLLLFSITKPCNFSCFIGLLAKKFFFFRKFSLFYL